MAKTPADFIRFLKYEYALAIIRALYEMPEYRGTTTDISNAHSKVGSLPNINGGVVERSRTFLVKNNLIEMEGKSVHKLRPRGIELGKALAAITELVEHGIDWTEKPQKQ